MKEQTYRPAWRSFYQHQLSLSGCFVFVAWLSIKYSLPPLVFRGLWYFCLFFVVLGVADMVYKRFSTRLTVKPDEITLEQGLIGRQSVVIGLKNIRTIQIKQTLMQRVLNVGDILISSTGADKYEIFVGKMPRPQDIRNVVQTNERAATGPEEKKQEELGKTD